MTQEEAYNKLVGRIEYVNDEFSIYPTLKTIEERAYFIGKMHQHIMEAAQVIADYKRSKKETPTINKEDTPIAGETT